MIKVTKSLMVIFSFFSCMIFSTNATFVKTAMVEGSQFSTGTWHTPEAKLVINEIDYDQPGADTAEFIEVMNTGDAQADLSEYTLKLINGANGLAVPYLTMVLPNVNLSTGGYYVVCSDNTIAQNCNLNIHSFMVQNGPADAVALLKNGVIVDTVSYDGSTISPYVEGSGAGLIDLPSAGNAGISRYPNGVDTNQNNIDFQMRSITPGSSNN